MAQGLRKFWRWTAYVAAGLVLLAVIVVLSAPYWLKGWLQDTVSARTGRELQIERLDIDWSLAPRLTGHQVRFGNADWAGQQPMAEIEELAVRIALLPLLGAQLVLPEVRVRNAAILLQRGPGEHANWIFGDRSGGSGKRKLPQIERLEIDNTRVRYIEPDRQTAVEATLTADPDAPAAQRLRAEGGGRYRGEPFELQFRGDGPLALLDPEDAYDLELQLAAADTEATLSGQILDPRALKASDLNLELKLSGPDPARLYKLVGLPLPSLPPYTVNGRLVREGQRWTLSKFDGRVGDSDLHGDIGLTLGRERPLLEATLRSDSLDFDDLGSLVGAAPGTGEGETASTQQRQAQQANRQRRALPDKPIDLKQVRSIDAEVRFQGKHVRAGKLPIDQVEVHFQLDNGRMRFDPLTFRAGGGKVDSHLSIDATGETLNAELDSEFVRLNLARLLADLDIANESVGQVGGRAKLWMSGNSAAALLASADGGVYLIMTGGRLDRILVELAGLDIGEVVLAKLGEGQSSIPINCGYADMQARDGALHLSNVVIDSSDTLFTASGTVNLATEQLDVDLSPNPKDVSLFAARSKLHIGGTLADPQVRPGSATLAKGAAAAALAAVAGPAAALVPLVETGGGQDSAACESFTRSVDASAVDAAPEKAASP